jgi:hypothetical protein
LSVSRLYARRKRLVAGGLWIRDGSSVPAERFQRVQVMPVSECRWSIDLPNGVRIGFAGEVDVRALSSVLSVTSRL